MPRTKSPDTKQFAAVRILKGTYLKVVNFIKEKSNSYRSAAQFVTQATEKKLQNGDRNNKL